MRKLLMAVLVLCLAWSTVAWAQTPEEAQALVKQGIAMVKDKGLDATLKAIADPKGPFVKGDLYLWAGYLDHVAMAAHPYKPDLVNKDLSLFRDIKGKQFFNDFSQLAADKGSGWVDYYWPKPGSQEPVLKTSYVERVPGQNYYLGCGIYK